MPQATAGELITASAMRSEPVPDACQQTGASRASWRCGRAAITIGQIVAAAFGMLLALSLFGSERLDPRQVGWTLSNADRAQHNLAWFFLRSEPWDLPLTHTSRIFPPEGASAAFFDVIPLAAIPLRLVDTWLPQPFQYYGLWALLSLTGTSCVAFALCRLATPDALACVLGAMLLTLSPALINQLHGHQSLTTHWLILGSLWLYLAGVQKQQAQHPRRWLVAQALLLALAAAVTPYLAVMVLVLACTLAAGLRLQRRIATSTALGFAGLAILVVLAVFALVGYLPSRDADAYSGGLYGKASFNLVSPLNPARHGSLLLPTLPVAFPQQARDAGYHYVGLGALVLLAAALPRHLHRIRAANWPADLPLVVAAAVLTAAAISPVVTFGEHVLLELPLPDSVWKLGSTFRASGRLFWPVGYLIGVAAIWGAVRHFRGWAAVALLAVAVAAQWLDTGGVRASVRQEVRRPWTAALDGAPWQSLGAGHRHLVVLPALQCGNEPPGGRESFPMFGWLAYQQRLTINSFYMARRSRAQIRRFCHSDVAALLDGKGLEGTAYVLSPQLATAVRLSQRAALTCRLVDGLSLCTSRDTSVAVGEPGAVPVELVTVPPDRPMHGEALSGALLYGWQPDGSLQQDRALLAFRLAEAGGDPGRLRLTLRSAPPLAAFSIRLATGRGADWRAEPPYAAILEAELPLLAGSDGNVLVDLDLQPLPGTRQDALWPWSSSPRLQLLGVEVVGANAVP